MGGVASMAGMVEEATRAVVVDIAMTGPRRGEKYSKMWSGIDLVISSYRIGSRLFLSGNICITRTLLNGNTMPIQSFVYYPQFVNKFLHW